MPLLSVQQSLDAALHSQLHSPISVHPAQLLCASPIFPLPLATTRAPLLLSMLQRMPPLLFHSLLSATKQLLPGASASECGASETSEQWRCAKRCSAMCSKTMEATLAEPKA